MVTPFSYDEYNIILNRVREKLPIVDYAEVIRENLDEYCVVRHDIEFSLERAYQLALVEQKIGVQSTYNIQVRNNNYNAFSERNIGLARDIWEMGHHIGLHVHMQGFNQGSDITQLNYFQFVDYIRKDVENLSHYLDISIDRFVFHRPKPMWLKEPVIVRGLINLYNTWFFHYYEGNRPDNMEVFYFSDSNHSWKWGHPLTEQSKINNGKLPTEIKKLQLLMHPYSWTSKGYSNEDNFGSLIKEKNVEMKQSMADEMISFPKGFL